MNNFRLSGIILASFLILIFSGFSLYTVYAAQYCATDNYGYQQCETLPDFPDIAGHFYKDAIEYVQENKIVQGYPDGTYKPDSTINRAEFTKILVEAKLGSTPDKASRRCFPDVDRNIWFEKYVCYAKNQNIIKGYPDGSFGPGNNINFAEAAKILINTFNITHDAEENGDLWYKTYLLALENQSAIPSSIDSAASPTTRGEMAELIWRIRENIQNKDSKTADELIPKPASVYDGYGDENFPNIDMAGVRESWLNWYNTERRKLGLHDYIYNNELNRSAYGWSEFSKDRGYISHKRIGQEAYYDYNMITAWFKNLGLEFENIYGVTYSENIGSGYVSCENTDCTQNLIDSARATFDFYMSEKGKDYAPHYNSVMNKYFNEIGLGIAIDANGKYYLTVHYGTRLK